MKQLFLPEDYTSVLDVWQTEQYHENSEYSFVRLNCPPSHPLSNDGQGAPVGYTGMPWSFLRGRA